AADVDGSPRARSDRRHDAVHSTAKAERPREVAPGAERQQTYGRRRREARGEQPRHDLARRAVAARDEHTGHGRAHALARDALGIPAGTRPLDAQRAERRAELRLEPVPATGGPPALAPRVHDDERLSRAH